MPIHTAAEARLADLHQFLLSKLDNNENDSAFAILKEIAAQARVVGVTCDVPTASPGGRLVYWQQMYDRARRFNQTDFALKVMREMRREDGR